MNGMDKLFIACVIFFIIDLSFVGTTTLAVLYLVMRILTGKTKIEFRKK